MKIFIISLLLVTLNGCAQYGGGSDGLLVTPDATPTASECPEPPEVTECPAPPKCEVECEACPEIPECETCEVCEIQDPPDCPDDGKKWKMLCHLPPGHTENKHTILVGESAVQAHLAHGDYLGPCYQ